MIRLNKFLSKAGIASRRNADLLLEQGRVSVNGQVVTQLGATVDETKDKILFDGKPIKLISTYSYLMLHKPIGYIVSAKDEMNRPVVLELIGEYRRYLKPVGRLDKDSSGLLLFTNDGELAFRLTHPRYKVDKTYSVKCRGKLTSEAMGKLEKGIELDDGPTYPAKVELISVQPEFSEFKITIHEGRKRQVRRMCEALGYRVTALKRISFGPLILDLLKEKNYRLLKDNEIAMLKKAVEL